MAALSPEQARLALVAVTDAAVTEASKAVSVDAAQTRQALFDVVPSTIAYYSDGSSALAADYYDDLRDDASAPGRFRADPVVNLRWGNPATEEKIRTGILWSVQPLLAEVPDLLLATSRVGEVVQLETARPFRDTITTNRRRDPYSTGWQRVTSGGCKFCRMLAGRGAVYKEETARFASHPHCHCSAVPVFRGQPGEEASTFQYVASQKTRTPAQRQQLREYLANMDGPSRSTSLAGATTHPVAPKAPTGKAKAPATSADAVTSLRGRLRAAEAAPGNNAIDIANLKQRIAALGG